MKNGREVDLDSNIHPIVFERQRPLIKQKCANIVAYINSGHFKFLDFKLFVLYSYTLLNRFNWGKVTLETVKNSMVNFDPNRYNQDKIYVKELSERLDIKHIRELFKINSNGNNILYDLIYQGELSPMLYIKKYDIGLREFEKSKYELSPELILFNKGIQLIKTIKTI